MYVVTEYCIYCILYIEKVSFVCILSLNIVYIVYSVMKIFFLLSFCIYIVTAYCILSLNIVYYKLYIVFQCPLHICIMYIVTAYCILYTVGNGILFTECEQLKPWALLFVKQTEKNKGFKQPITYLSIYNIHHQFMHI